MIPVYFRARGRVCYIVCPDIGCDDVWGLVEAYDQEHGTDWYGYLATEAVLGLTRSPVEFAIRVTIPAEIDTIPEKRRFSSMWAKQNYSY